MKESIAKEFFTHYVTYSFGKIDVLVTLIDNRSRSALTQFKTRLS